MFDEGNTLTLADWVQSSSGLSASRQGRPSGKSRKSSVVGLTNWLVFGKIKVLVFTISTQFLFLLVSQRGYSGSSVTCHMSPVNFHLSSVTCQLSPARSDIKVTGRSEWVTWHLSPKRSDVYFTEISHLITCQLSQMLCLCQREVSFGHLPNKKEDEQTKRQAREKAHFHLSKTESLPILSQCTRKLKVHDVFHCSCLAWELDGSHRLL